MFQKVVELKSDLSKVDIIQKLKDITEDWLSDNNSTKKFEGTINSDGVFEIHPTFNYNARNQLRPKINGRVNGDNFGASVSLVFSLEKNTFYLILLSIVASIIGAIITYLINFEIKWYVFLGFPVLFLIFATSLYNSKVNESISVLKNLLQ